MYLKMPVVCFVFFLLKFVSGFMYTKMAVITVFVCFILFYSFSLNLFRRLGAIMMNKSWIKVQNNSGMAFNLHYSQHMFWFLINEKHLRLLPDFCPSILSSGFSVMTKSPRCRTSLNNYTSKHSLCLGSILYNKVCARPLGLWRRFNLPTWPFPVCSRPALAPTAANKRLPTHSCLSDSLLSSSVTTVTYLSLCDVLTGKRCCPE